MITLETSTTNRIENKTIDQHFGIVDVSAISGTFIVKDIFSVFRDFFGGRSRSYEKTLEKTKQEAMEELKKKAEDMGANALLGISFDIETIRGSMFLVHISATAVRVA